ncbi:ScbA/BarX family gamma-butyrolactone biosynthesis protein [Streptomyces sp. A 4/2]|uniref:ScbA/BarX family gamma-butyrolactone biosynthesis protein n=1 Tax=Streptomyces sp. A 4/2 TaxID=2934314 RepID=UPI002024E407|nr:ScbA/BarX family gamma-butyrolactone biosynthesis protein [Streptomyces sp. A 4/2]
MTLLTHAEMPGTARETAVGTVPVKAYELPRLTTTVPREYVHRASHAEVFLTHCEKLDDTCFLLAGQWPRAHPFFTSLDGTLHDPMQAAETIRQVGLLLAHSEFGVPLGHSFLMWEQYFTAYPAHMAIGCSPTDLTITAVCTDLRWKGSRLAEFSMEVTLESDSRTVAVGGGRFTCISPGTYRRLRGGAGPEPTGPRPAPAHPASVGRARAADVVLSPTATPGRWLLNPDPLHPILFDHSGDHIPGMVLVEAARQAACGLIAPTGMIAESVTTSFHQYAEFDAPCWIEATVVPADESNTMSISVVGRQSGNEVFRSLLACSLNL